MYSCRDSFELILTLGTVSNETSENEKSVPHKEFTDTDKADKDKIETHSRYCGFIWTSYILLLEGLVKKVPVLCCSCKFQVSNKSRISNKM